MCVQFYYISCLKVHVMYKVHSLYYNTYNVRKYNNCVFVCMFARLSTIPVLGCSDGVVVQESISFSFTPYIGQWLNAGLYTLQFCFFFGLYIHIFYIYVLLYIVCINMYIVCVKIHLLHLVHIFVYVHCYVL